MSRAGDPPVRAIAAPDAAPAPAYPPAVPSVPSVTSVPVRPAPAPASGAGGAPPRVLVVDNYDSFVFNIVHYLAELGAECVVRERAAVVLPRDIDDVDGILLSPGPGHPSATGVCLDLVRDAGEHRRPLLGVCLGHQVIAVACGGSVGRAPEIVHGATSDIRHDGTGVFTGLPDPFSATRYHSLATDPTSVPDVLRVTATTGDGVIMGLRHRRLPLEGIQFHPESVLSEGGHRLFGNWLSGLSRSRHVSRREYFRDGVTRPAADTTK